MTHDWHSYYAANPDGAGIGPVSQPKPPVSANLQPGKSTSVNLQPGESTSANLPALPQVLQIPDQVQPSIQAPVFHLSSTNNQPTSILKTKFQLEYTQILIYI